MADDQAPSSPEVEAQGDALLATFVRALNTLASDDSAFGVTLWVGGLMVSGELVGRKTYFEGMAREFAVESGDDEGFAKIFNEMSASVTDTMDDDTPIGFVHLRNARTYVAGQAPVPANRGVWWRGRIESIDAFSFGLLSAN